VGRGAASCLSGRDAPVIRDFNLASKKQVVPWECENTHWPRPMGWQDAEKSCPDQIGVSRARFLVAPWTGRSGASLGMTGWEGSSAAYLAAPRTMWCMAPPFRPC
jgi:hypothetical protein